MGKLIGTLVGLVLGTSIGEGVFITLVLTGAGFAVGAAVDRQRAAQRAQADPGGVAARLASVEARLDALESRFASPRPGAPARDAIVPAIEQHSGIVAVVPAAPTGDRVDVPLPATGQSPSGHAGAPPRPAYDAGPPPRPAYGAAAGAAAISPAVAADVAHAADAPRAPGRGLLAWFAEGNTLTRVGVVILFFGVAFLLSWFADHLTLSIEATLALVAFAGAVLIGVGAKLAGSRPGYALSLEGAGAGILYLTTFAASRLFDVLPPLPAMAALVAVAALTVALAWRADSQPMAGLAIAGGFLAPFLVARAPGEPAALFAWFAVLNAAIVALAWHRAWRALNALGAVFTFGLGIFWGWRYYVPQHFAVAQPFLALFFAFYLGVAILYAKRAPLEQRKPVDALVVFGVPVMAFALEAGLLADWRYGASVAALAMAATYAVLFVALRRRLEPGLALLAQSFLALAVVFATLAVPFAVDARWTSAWWALEAAAVYWIGCRQDQRIARAFALALQACAAAAFVLGGVPRGAMPAFANAGFLGAAMLGAAALATARAADRHRAALSEGERSFVAVVFAWGVAWWMLAGAVDIARARPAWLGPGVGTAALAWVAASAAVALALRLAMRWDRLAWFGAAIAPALVLAGIAQYHDARTTLAWPGVVVWPLAWALHWVTLRTVEPAAETDVTAEEAHATFAGPAWLRDAHAASAIALVAWASWEASEWTGRTTPRGSAWIACAAALPAIAGLAATLVPRAMAHWPLARFPDAYARNAGWVVASALAAWFLGTSIVSPGGAAPLPWLPLANPLDVTLAAALVTLALWARDRAAMPQATREHWLGAALFVAGNGFILRVAHHYGGVPWRLSSLLAEKPVQAAITLAWTATALVLMVWASRRALRARWLTGAVLLAAVVVKLFAVDLAALSGLPRIAAFLGAGAMLLAIGYFAPPPAARADDTPGAGSPP
ncbi:hypothetical protein BURK1_01072 [Burkholderiales bacterium]|nr:hypothetical protein BURK1_01072 [Burkholderiales bacterium]